MTLQNNIIIIVPYRGRPSHLCHFVDHMNKACPNQNIFIVEQSEHKPFNRAKLLNIGYLENKQYKHFVFHDIDMLPVDVNYSIKYTCPVVQLAGSHIQLFDYLGGVTRFSNSAFKKVGGYNNEYYHRAEDNEMMFNLKRLSMNVIRKPGKYATLDHERTGPEFNPALWELAKQPRIIQDQLSVCKYKIVDVAIHENENIKHIVVSL